MSEHTQATAIAAVEARRNEDQTIAEGALLGEQRASIARLVMVALFGLSSEVLPHATGNPAPFDPTRLAVGLAFTLYAFGTFYVVRRVKPSFRAAFRRPLVLTTVDITFVSTMAWFDLRDGRPHDPALLAAALAVLISFTVARVSLIHVAVAVALAIVSFVGIGAYGDALETERTMFVVGGFCVLGVIIGMTNRAVRTMFGALRRRDNLTRFLPRPVAERILAGGPEALAPVQREVTVLFSDIRGFTSLSEALAPRAVLELLDEYFGRMSTVVKGHDGVVGKFIGDGLMAFWGVPDRDDDHAARAVRAALDMQRSIAEMNAGRAAEDERWQPLRVGIGIHTGPVAAGMLGGAEHAEYTVIGDAVNVASRIEGLTKDRGEAVLVSESTWARCGDRFRGRRLEAAEIRGRKEPVGLYAVDPGE